MDDSERKPTSPSNRPTDEATSETLAAVSGTAGDDSTKSGSDISADATLPATDGQPLTTSWGGPGTDETLPAPSEPSKTQARTLQKEQNEIHAPDSKEPYRDDGISTNGDRVAAASGTVTAKDSAPPTEHDLTEVTPECPRRYTILWEAGRGGIGRVVLAEDHHTGRQIAIKELIAPQTTSSPSPSVTGATARFLWEAKITAQLEHPAIVPVYEIGRRRDGTFYYTMKFIRGKTLLEALSQAADLSQRLSFLPHFSNLCNAVAFAHSKGILHRDIKPGNVMLGEFGETLVIDWGLAKTAGGKDRDNSSFSRQAETLKGLAAGQTMMGQAVGTPAYMPPEQARGKHEEVDESSDVYALGAVLYQLLTGQPPFTGETAQDILLKVIDYSSGDLPLSAPTDLEPDVPPELSAVAVKALSPDKRSRYASAKDLVRDVEAFMTGGRVSAYRYSTMELITRFIRRHRTVTAASAAVVLAIVSALVVTSIAYKKEAAARRRERRARILEHRQRLTAHWHLAVAHLHKALNLASDHRAIEAGLSAAKGLLEDPACKGSPYYDPEFLPPREQDAKLVKPKLASMVYLARTSPLAGVTKAFSLREDPRHVTLSAATGNLLVASRRGMEVIGLEPGHRRLNPPQGLTVAVSGDGRALAIRRPDGRLEIWHPDSNETTILPVSSGLVRTAAFASSDHIALGSRTGVVEIRDIRSGRKLATAEVFLTQVDHLAACNDDILAASSGRRLAIVWAGAKSHRPKRTLNSGQRIPSSLLPRNQRLLIQTPSPVTALSISPDCRWLAIGSDDGAILLRPLDGNGALRRLSAHHDMVTSLRFSPDGGLLVSGSWDGTIRLWNNVGQALGAVEAHKQGVRALALSPNADFIVSVGADRRALLWRLAQPRPVRAFLSAIGRIKSATFSRDGLFVAAGGTQRAAAVWSRGAPKQPLAYLLGGSTIRALAFSADSRTFFYSYDGVLQSVLWPDAKLLETKKAHRGAIRSLQACPTGDLLITAGMDGHLKGWADSTKTRVFDFDVKGRILRASLSPDCRQIAVATGNGRVLLWSLAGPRAPAKVLIRHPSLVSAVAFSPDGALVASAGQDAVIFVQNRTTGRVLARLKAHGRWINRVVFSPNGRLLASGGDDRRVWLWDTETWRPLLFIATQREVTAMAFSPDGKWLAVGDAEQLLLYPMDFEGLTADPAKILADTKRRLGLLPPGTTAGDSQ